MISKIRTFTILPAILISLSSLASTMVIVTDDKQFIGVMNEGEDAAYMPEKVYESALKGLAVKAIYLASTQRIEMLMDDDVPMCTPYRLKTPERIDKYRFSLPTDVFVNRTLYQYVGSKAIDPRFLNQKGEVASLSALMASHENYTLLIGASHSYGAVLDAQIQKIPAQNLYILHGSNPYDSLLNMLIQGRVDFYLSYPSIINNSDMAKLVRSYTIAEVPHYDVGYLMCNQHPDSLAFLEQFNRQLQKMYESGEFDAIARQFLTPEEYRQLKPVVASFLTLSKQ